MDNSGRDYDLQDMCWRWTFDDIHLEQRLEAVERTLFEEYAKMNEKDSVTTKEVHVDQGHDEEMIRYRVIARNEERRRLIRRLYELLIGNECCSVWT